MPRRSFPNRNRLHQRQRPRSQPPEGDITDGVRLPRGLLTPRSAYRRQILGLLVRADDHEIASREIRRAVERRMTRHFTRADLSALRNRQPRWVNSMQWERKQMVMEGLLETTGAAGHGVWRLTREGVRAARSDG